MGVNGWYFWKTHHDERGFASMHTCHVTSGTLVVGASLCVNSLHKNAIATSSFCRCRKVISRPLECDLSHAAPTKTRVWLALFVKPISNRANWGLVMAPSNLAMRTEWVARSHQRNVVPFDNRRRSPTGETHPLGVVVRLTGR